jgi:hypothetical protein
MYSARGLSSLAQPSSFTFKQRTCNRPDRIALQGHPLETGRLRGSYGFAIFGKQLLSNQSFHVSENWRIFPYFRRALTRPSMPLPYGSKVSGWPAIDVAAFETARSARPLTGTPTYISREGKFFLLSLCALLLTRLTA